MAVVVLAIALAVGVASERWEAPQWLEQFGAWTSILFLTLIGVVNLHAVLTASPGEVVAPVGLKGRLLGRLNRASHPLTVALVGALFALSFDTVSQSALFALTATQFGGVGHALLLGSALRFRDAGHRRHQRTVDLPADRACRSTRLRCLPSDEPGGVRSEPAGCRVRCGEACVADRRCMERRQGTRVRLCRRCDDRAVLCGRADARTAKRGSDKPDSPLSPKPSRCGPGNVSSTMRRSD